MKTILTINAGSSSIKFALYKQAECILLYKGSINNLFEAPLFKVHKDNKVTIEKKIDEKGHTSALKTLVEWIKANGKDIDITAVGHRIVHGGRLYSKPVLISKKTLSELEKLIPLAPLHQPYNVEAVKVMLSLFPKAKQVACFDTAFHTTCNHLARLYSLPRKYIEQGIVRYGFHGLSYEYINSILPEFIGKKANGKIIVAHLGNGSSMCAINNRKSVSTTMGFTALDGLMMGTRAGSLDPGIILYLQQNNKLTVKEVENLLYKESGLLGVSGISHDIEILQTSKNPDAKEAIDLFCYRAAQEIAKLTLSLQGLDALVFTAGIGENSILIRKKICELLRYMGIKIDNKANKQNKSCISLKESPVIVFTIPTNEEFMIAKHTLRLTI